MLWCSRWSSLALADPSDTIDRARDRARQMVETAKNHCPLSDDQKAEIQRLLDAADREAVDSLTR